MSHFGTLFTTSASSRVRRTVSEKIATRRDKFERKFNFYLQEGDWLHALQFLQSVHRKQQRSLSSTTTATTTQKTSKKPLHVEITPRYFQMLIASSSSSSSRPAFELLEYLRDGSASDEIPNSPDLYSHLVQSYAHQFRAPQLAFDVALEGNARWNFDPKTKMDVSLAILKECASSSSLEEQEGQHDNYYYSFRKAESAWQTALDVTRTFFSSRNSSTSSSFSQEEGDSFSSTYSPSSPSLFSPIPSSANKNKDTNVNNSKMSESREMELLVSRNRPLLESLVTQCAMRARIAKEKRLEFEEASRPSQEEIKYWQEVENRRKVAGVKKLAEYRSQRWAARRDRQNGSLTTSESSVSSSISSSSSSSSLPSVSSSSFSYSRPTRTDYFPLSEKSAISVSDSGGFRYDAELHRAMSEARRRGQTSFDHASLSNHNNNNNNLSPSSSSTSSSTPPSPEAFASPRQAPYGHNDRTSGWEHFKMGGNPIYPKGSKVATFQSMKPRRMKNLHNPDRSWRASSSRSMERRNANYKFGQKV